MGCVEKVIDNGQVIYRDCHSAVTQTPPASGPGTELKKLLQLVGIKASPTCSCNARAATMDRNGCEWCEEHLAEIVGWLREEAAKRGLPFLDGVGKLLVRRAISNARKERARAEAKEGKSEGHPAV